MVEPIERHREALRELCRRFRVARLEVFGSAATGRFDPQRSDLDFLVEFQDDYPQGPFRQYFDLLAALEVLFERKVDLVEEPAMKNPYFIKAVNDTRLLLYAT